MSTPMRDEPTRLRADIVQLRGQLTDTVAALTQKADVRSRIEDRVGERVLAVVVKAEPLARRADMLMRTAWTAVVPRVRQVIALVGPHLPDASSVETLRLSVARWISKR